MQDAENKENLYLRVCEHRGAVQEIAAATGYTSQHVRRILKANGKKWWNYKVMAKACEVLETRVQQAAEIQEKVARVLAQ